MQFWCSFTNTAWDWSWRPFPGVWLFVLLLGWGAFRLNRAGGGTPRPVHPLTLLGLVFTWIALDWPVGALGAGYLASVHMAQFLLLGLLVPAALLAGLRPESQEAIARSRAGGVLERITRPVSALILFNIIVLITHLPPIVDRLMPTQLGSMAIDLLWFVAGLIFWYPMLVDAPVRPRFVPPLRMLYLVVGLMFSPVMFGLVGFMLYAEHPLYGLYELAPPFPGWTSKMDHELAAVMMSVTGALVAFIGLSTIFFKWSKTDA
ncbi:MAG: cytochrome c oxidase assembly protein [Gemmatimonadetes bacterium]|nr:cytochrome c oxidase assembly protein [Gemmatimonadota bacterium]